MPVVDDLSEAISRFADGLTYDLIKFSAEALWWILKSGIMLSWQVMSIDRWFTDNVFPPLIQATSNGTYAASSVMFFLAILIAGLTYMLAIWVKIDVVNPRKAMLWFLAGAIFFQMGPQFYAGFHDLRSSLAAGFFGAGVDGIQNSSGNPFSPFQAVQDTDPLIPYDLCDNYGPYFVDTRYHTDHHGVDVALAFLRANGVDVMGYMPPYSSGGWYCGQPPYQQHELPQWWIEKVGGLGGYFDENYSSAHFDEMSDGARRVSIEFSFLGLRRLIAAIPLVMMGIVESFIYLLLTLAEGVVFLSFSIALVFSYFNRTELIALSVIDQMIELMVQTAIIALLQSLIMGLTFAAASTPNPFLLLGMGTVAMIMMTILLWSGIKALFGSFNRLFQAMGQVTGRSFITPTQAGIGAAGMAMGAGLVTAGAGMAGASMAGSAFNRNQDDQPSNKSRALRGSNRLMQAGVYSLAAGTGNPRIAQLGHLTAMLSHRAPQRVQSKSYPPNMQPQPSTTASTQIAERTQAMPQAPSAQKSNTTPTAIEKVGEELEQTLTANQQNIHREQKLTPKNPRRDFDRQADRLNLTNDQRELVLNRVQASPDGQLTSFQTGMLRNWVGRDMSSSQANAEMTKLISLANRVPQDTSSKTDKPNITVNPQITVEPQITVQSNDASEAKAKEAALRGSQPLNGAS